jgi:hypothetical protein
MLCSVFQIIIYVSAIEVASKQHIYSEQIKSCIYNKGEKIL